jgi:RNA polymerase sigma-70 factor (ECF subfamily)
MAPDPDFQALMGRLRQGEPEAARQIFDRFGQRLIALARTRLHGPLRAKLDPEDVLQSVFRSFFRRHAQASFDLDNWDSLWALLTVLTLRRCGFYTRYFRSQCRQLRREAAPALSETSLASWEAIAREPTPSEAAVLNETVEQLLRGLAGRDRQIVELSLQGYGAAEVSAQVSCSERTVYRLLARVRKRLERLGAGEDARS